MSFTKVKGQTGDLKIPNIEVTDIGGRIRADFSNATIANRVMFQTSTVNGGTSLGVVPNGTNQTSSYNAFNSTDTANASTMTLLCAGTEARIQTSITGTGSFLPMTFYTGGSERMRIATDGNIGFNTSTTSNGALNVNGVPGKIAYYNSGVFNAEAGLGVLTGFGDTFGINARQAGGIVAFGTNNTERLRIDSNGNVLVNNNTGGLGYGTGAGGTVTQATSKGTSVTLNRPCGQITMNNAALGAGASVEFTVNNTLCSSADTVLVSKTWDAIPNANYRVECSGTGISAFVIRVTNITAGSLSEAVAIKFAIIKGATS